MNDSPSRTYVYEPHQVPVARTVETKADPREPLPATGRLILGKLVIPSCPHCGQRHRYRFRGWNVPYEAVCGGVGGFVPTREGNATP